MEAVTKERLDILIMRKLNISRTLAARLIDEGKVSGSADKLRSSTRFSSAEFENLSIENPETKKIEIKAENIPLKIVYQDSDLLVVHKPAGMVVHPACGNYNNTMVNALLFHCHDLSDVGDVKRPGIVHRLDKDTEGLLVVAKNNQTHQLLSKQFEKHTVTRKYLALVSGDLTKDEGTITGNLARSSANRKKIAVVKDKGKHAITHYQVIKRHNTSTLVEVELETGRTHQIRVHFAYLQHPLIGDIVYNKDYAKKESDLRLIAFRLGFIHPTTKKYLEFTAELPEWVKKYS